MNQMGHMIRQIQPEVYERAGGGWLAVAPPGALIRIGTTGITEQDARKKFANALDRWAAAREEYTESEQQKG